MLPLLTAQENRMIHFRRIAYSFVLLLWVLGIAVAQDDAIEPGMESSRQQVVLPYLSFRGA